MIILLLVFSFVAGCGLIETNYEKDMQRTIAYIGDADVYQDEIKKYEFVSYFMSSASNYLQNGYTMEETVDELLNQMVYQRIVVQEIVSFLLQDFETDSNKSALRESLINNGFTYYRITGYVDSFDKSLINTDNEYSIFNYEKVTFNIKEEMTLKDILDPQDITVKVVSVGAGGMVKQTEENAKSSDMLTFLLRVYYGNYQGITAQQFTAAMDNATNDFETYYKALKSSSGFSSSAGFLEKDGFSDYLAIQAYNSVWSSQKSALDSIEEQLRKELNIEAKEEEKTSSKSTRAIPKKDALERAFTRPEPNEEEDSYLRQEAFKKFEKQIKDNQFGLTYEEFFEKQLKSELEQGLIKLYEIVTIRNQDIDEENFIERFNRILKSEQQQFNLSLNDYKTQLKGVDDTSFVLYNLDAGIVGYVQHILLGINTDENKLINKQLTELKRKELDRVSYLSARRNIFNGVKVKDLREDMEDGNYDEDRFPGYDAFSDHVYLDIADFYENKFKVDFGEIATLTTDVYQTALTDETLFDKFQQYVYMYNTDPGMFNSSIGYLVLEPNTLNESKDYQPEFAKGSKDVIQKTFEARKDEDYDSYFYTMVATDFGWHIILCTDIIFPGRVVLEEDIEDAFADIQTAVKTDSVTFTDLKNPIYKLYKIIQNELGKQSYNDKLNDFINDFYVYDNGSKITLRKDRIQDLYNL